MKKFLLIFFLLLITITGFSQQFSQYNTGTLYDSFENPSVRTFIPDTSQMFASNFFVPNFNLNFLLSGNAQTAAKSRLFSSYYNTADLKIGTGKTNHLTANMNDYSFMFKMFPNLNGNVELGFSINTKLEGQANFTDESIALFNGPSNFPLNSYNNIFNDNFYYQLYQQIGVTYREQLDDRFAVGFKFNLLSGVTYDKVEINQSHIDFDKPNDAATIYLQGKNYTSSNENNSTAQNLLPNFHNPGMSINVGFSYKTDDGFIIQGNLKDFGFIHWNSQSTIYNFNNSLAGVKIGGLSGTAREDSIYNKINFLANTNKITTDFTTHTNGLIEISANRSYWLGGNESIKFSPTFIASKEIYYPGFTGALVAPFQVGKYVVTATSSYNNLNLFSFGAQFMIKTPHSEFFIGSEKLFQSIGFISDAIHSSSSSTQPQIVTNPTGFTGMDFFIGYSVKFGNIIERDMNSSYVPDGGKGFLGRLIDKIFPDQHPIKDH